MRDFGKKITSSTLVSIIIDTFYRPKMLENAVTHILQQTYKNIEIIVSDNCSTDDTSSLASNFAKRYSNFKYFRNIKQANSIKVIT